MALLRDWTLGFCPLNAIERVPQRSDRRARVERGAAHGGRRDRRGRDGDARAGRHPDRLHRQQVAASGSPGARLGRGRTRDANTLKIRLEYALVITFLYGQTYDCNEYCKYYKNVENAHYKFIPMVHRTHYDGSVSHVTGIVNITAEEYEAMPPRFDGEWLRGNFPGVAAVDGPVHRQDQGGDARRDPRRPRDRPDPARPVPGSQRDQPAVAHGGTDRPPVRQLAGVPRRRLGHRLSVLPVDLARLRVRDVPGGPHRAA